MTVNTHPHSVNNCVQSSGLQNQSYPRWQFNQNNNPWFSNLNINMLHLSHQQGQTEYAGHSSESTVMSPLVSIDHVKPLL